MTSPTILQERAAAAQACLFDVLALLRATTQELADAAGEGRDRDGMTCVSSRGTSLMNIADAKVREAIRLLEESR